MAFNTFQFILVFLPLVYLGFLAVHRFFGWAGVYPYLAAASLVFYAQFSFLLAAVLVGSVVLNFLAANLIRRTREAGQSAGWMTAAAIAVNIFALGYFKYTNFFIDIVNSVGSGGFSHLNIIVPVGVSFFTFTQIGFLLESYSGQAGKVGFAKYSLFATFFPVVTAGPLLLQREIFPQMEDKQGSAFSTVALSVGLTMFGIGLFKKVIIADSIAPYANVAFDGVALGASIDMLNAWMGSLIYTFQLYFDFSGYSDMAVGLGFMFGLKLPLNFNSPFKATSISDFWRRWHMTMTRFFTTYLYTPMAMTNTRKAAKEGYGPLHRWLAASAVPVTYTFVLAGIWHGAGWTFVVYGLIHGLALAVNHGWRHFRLVNLGPQIGWLLTMLVVVVGLVIFRAADLNVAVTILSSMFGLNLINGAAPSADVVSLDAFTMLSVIALLGAIVMAAPNSQEILRSNWISCDDEADSAGATQGEIRWQPTAMWAVIAAVMLVVAFTSLGENGNFLYYSF